MLVKGIIDTDIVNYKKISMTIEFPFCSFKCDKECGRAVCQNSSLANEPNIEISDEKIIGRYLSNPITEAIVCQGLEPLDSDSPFDIMALLTFLRKKYNRDDDFVIYTGYNKNEIEDWIIDSLKNFGNVIIKYGRYIPDQEPHYDEVLGVNLASDNQYAERL